MVQLIEVNVRPACTLSMTILNRWPLRPCRNTSEAAAGTGRSPGRVSSVGALASGTRPSGVTGTAEKMGTVAMSTSTVRTASGSRGYATCSTIVWCSRKPSWTRLVVVHRHSGTPGASRVSGR